MKIQTLLKLCAAVSWLQRKWDGAFNTVYSIPHTLLLGVWSQQEKPRSRQGSAPSCLALSREKVLGSARCTRPLFTTVSSLPIPLSCGFKMWCWRTAMPSPRQLLQGKLQERREKSGGTEPSSAEPFRGQAPAEPSEWWQGQRRLCRT